MRCQGSFFDYAFLGSKGEEATQAIQVGRERRTGMLFAHHVPRKGLVSAHGAAEMLKDLDRLGYGRVLLKCDNEPALVSVQKEVVRLRAKDTITENSPAEESKANGVAERAVRSFGEQMRAIRAGLQDLLQVHIPGNHALTSWMVEHAADLINKVAVGVDGRTAYRRLRGKQFRVQVVEFGERVHHRRHVKGQILSNKLDCPMGRRNLSGDRLEIRGGIHRDGAGRRQSERHPSRGGASPLGQ